MPRDDKYDKQPNPLHEVTCNFLSVGGKFFVELDSLSDSYKKILEKSDIFIESGRPILEKQGVDVNNDFSNGFRAAISVMSGILKDQSSDFNIKLEFRDQEQKQ